MYKEAIEKYFEENKDKMLDDISKLIRIPSEKGQAEEGMPFGKYPAEALNEAAKIAGGMGFSVKNYDNYVIAIDMNNKEKCLDILAHLDVVAPGRGWSITQPFEPIIKDGKLYGRGSADDKGPSMAALYAMKAVKDMGIPLKKNVRLVLGSDEECGSGDMKHYYSIEEEAPMTFSPDGSFPVINIEKGRFGGPVTAAFEENKELPRVISVSGGTTSNIVPDMAEAEIEGIDKAETEKFAAEIEKETGVKFAVKEKDGKIIINADGKSAHASTPMEGKNAVTAMIKLLSGMPFAESEGFKRLRGMGELFPHGDFHGDAAGVHIKDDISGEITMTLDIFRYSLTGLKGIFDARTPVCANKENLSDIFCAKAEALGLTVEDKEVGAAHYVPADSYFVKTLLKSYEEYSNREGRCIAIGGGTYVHHLKNGVAFGACLEDTDNRMHGADEFAVIDELLMSAKIFTQVIIDLCA